MKLDRHTLRLGLLGLILFLLPALWPLSLAIKLQSLKLGWTLSISLFHLVVSQLLLLFTLNKSYLLRPNKAYAVALWAVSIVLIIFHFFILPAPLPLLLLIEFLLVHLTLFARRLLRIISTITMTACLVIFQHVLMLANLNTLFPELVGFYICLFLILFSVLMRHGPREDLAWENRYNTLEIIIFALASAILAWAAKDQLWLMITSYALTLAGLVISFQQERLTPQTPHTDEGRDTDLGPQ